MNTARVLMSVAEHLDSFELAEPIQITAAPCAVGPRATVQLSGASVSTLVGELLAWADTLDNATVTLWRPPFDDGDPVVFLELRGRLTDDTPVKVFGGLLDGPYVAAGRRTEVSWGRLREWAVPVLEVAA
nr:hypothetical protein [Kibdelosporangium sp. MJ126-NF4]CEL14019.1 hypothetical protein [Kibdelosporangium sp. MJ126-NF4]CTQ88385.1 hypothetical protein [Kibdelosporangium sp. MJ126-NF4]